MRPPGRRGLSSWRRTGVGAVLPSGVLLSAVLPSVLPALLSPPWPSPLAGRSLGDVLGAVALAVLLSVVLALLSPPWPSPLAGRSCRYVLGAVALAVLLATGPVVRL